MVWDDRLFAIDGHSLIGTVIQKDFNTGTFNGKVVGCRYTKGNMLFRVVYSDDDVEDLTSSEILDNIPVSDICPSDRMKLASAVERWMAERDRSICSNMQERF